MSELACRTLRILAAEWARVQAEFAARCPAGASVAGKLESLRAAWEAVFLPSPARAAPGVCPACGGPVHAAVARGALVYGACAECGHGLLLAGAAPPEVHRAAAYWSSPTAGGAGYADYQGERAYREEKARALLRWALEGRASATLLEVGSGFGYARAAAEQLGLRTAGVELSEHAAGKARELYGMETAIGTLIAALEGPLRGQRFDLILYQFVLEHLADAQAELQAAASALAPGGALVLVVPSMEAAEARVFGGHYRSLREDHLHLFTRRSLSLLLACAGLQLERLESRCSLNLMSGFLSPEELTALYARGQGPDFAVLAGRTR